MLMGLAGPGLWRTSTLSTKRPGAGFSHVLSDMDEMQKAGGDTGRSSDDENGPNHWITHHFVCLFSFQGNFLFLGFEKGRGDDAEQCVHADKSLSSRGCQGCE